MATVIRIAKLFLKKWQKDNVGVLASVIAWNCLTSIAPVVVGFVAIAGLILSGDPSGQKELIDHLSSGLVGVLSPKDLTALVDGSVHHSGILGVIGFLGVLWGGSNVGSAMSTTFRTIFATQSRPFVKEKLLDVVMILVMAVLLIVIVVGTTAGAVVTNLIRDFPLSSPVAFCIGTVISIAAGSLLFGAIYLAFPNISFQCRIRTVWKGAVTAAVLFTLLSYIWPLYAHFAHFSRYGAVLLPVLILTGWIYFFAVIVCIGAELVAIEVGLQQKRGEAPKHTGQ